jgi:hypothetical protein
MVTKPASPWYYAGATGGITDTTAVTVSAAAVSGQRNFLSGLQYLNTSDPPLQSVPNSTLQVKMVTTGTATRVSAQGFIDP